MAGKADTCLCKSMALDYLLQARSPDEIITIHQATALIQLADINYTIKMNCI